MAQSASGRNTLGIWAFVFSLTGVSCLPVIGSIVGLVLGIMAVRREPRGLSIAAIVIATIGGCLVPLVAAPFALLIPALAKARSTAARVRVGNDTVMVVDAFHTRKGRMPRDLAEAFGDERFVPLDEWGTPMRLEIDAAASGTDAAGLGGGRLVKYRIVGAGEDKQWGSADDRLITEGMVFRNASGTPADGSEPDTAPDGVTEEDRGEAPGEAETDDAPGAGSESGSR